MTRVALTSLAAALAALVVVASAAAGAAVRAVDVSAYPTVRVTVVGSRSQPALRENGHPATGVSAVNLARSKSVVLAVDRSRSMTGGALEDAVAAARRFVAAKPAGDRVALVAFGSKAVQLTAFSSGTGDTDGMLRTMAVDGRPGTALYDGVVLAARAVAGEAFPGRVIIVLTDGRDVSSAATLARASKAARRAGASVYAVAIEGRQFSPAPLRRLAAETGGRYYGARSSAALAGIYAAIARELEQTWRLEYSTAARPGDRLSLAAGPSGEPFELRLPGRAGSGPGDSQRFYASPLGTAILAFAVGGLVFAALGLALAAPSGGWLRARLAPHVAPRREQRAARKDGRRLATLAAMFDVTERAFGHLKPWRRIHRLLERADLPLRTVELVYASAGAALLFGLVAAVAALPALLILFMLALGFALPIGAVWFKARRRAAAFEEQLPDLLVTLAASLKAGHSFRQGIQTVVDEGHAPASKEFGRVLSETKLGRPMDEALAEMADRAGSKNLSFVVTAVTIQRQVGGSLAGLFDMVADTVRQRQQFARKIKSLTAMGRMSAYVLIGLPFFVALALTVLNREYMDPLLNTSAGHKLIVLGLVMMVFGSAVLKKIVSFKG